MMGIVNASPDSFSDGGRTGASRRWSSGPCSLVADGAAMIDVGGESGGPTSPPVPPRRSCERVVPLVERLAADGVLVSVDTWKPAVAQAALEAGAALINDVSGLRDPELAGRLRRGRARASWSCTHARARR